MSLPDFPMRSMRTSCLAVMELLGEKCPYLVAMGADGRSIFDTFASRFPHRFVDVGIAEANLLGVAAGIARTGKIVFVSAIASFLLRRAYEQIRNDVCDPGLPVKLVGVGGGLSYGALGPTHHMTEDIALTRVLPNMAVFIPADAHDAEGSLHAALEWPGPAYIRLGTGFEPLIHQEEKVFVPYKPEVLRPGQDIMIFATGYGVSQALLAAVRLEQLGHDVGVANVHTLKPIDDETILELARGRQAVLVVEEHSLMGGLGSVVAELMSRDPVCRLERMGIADRYPPVGSREELIAFYGLDDARIVETVCKLLYSHSARQHCNH